MNLESFLIRIRQARTTASLFRILQEAARQAGLEHVAYAALQDHASYEATTHAPPAVRLTYPDRWVTHYYEQGYDKIDPVLSHTIDIGVPYLWHWLPKMRRLGDLQRRVLEEAREAGLRQGMTVPLNGPHGTRAVLSFATGSESTELEPHLGRLGLYAAIFHCAFVEKVGIGRRGLPAKALSRMELACLGWVAQGKTSWEVGAILGIRETTARAYLRRALRKLGAPTRAMAVARAMHLGLIE